MSAFSARLLKNAIRQLKKLDPKVARRIAEQITWLSEHFEEIRAEPLKGDLAGTKAFSFATPVTTTKLINGPSVEGLRPIRKPAQRN